MPVFDIPTERLVDLTDAELRELVARLCEAERERQGGHRTEVRWGGSQTAADGGLDVVVEPVGTFVAAGPLRRRDAGIQVKAGDLAPAAITEEMRYGGSLRPAISSLAQRNGTYLIASAGASCSEAMLERRINAMRAAVADDPNGAGLALSFLDRNAISRWVTAHPSVTAWLRRRLTLPVLTGWQPYGRWSSTPEEEVDDLICEEGLAFYIGRHDPIRSLPDALDAVRELVRDGTGAARIAGLSGIGKSRIVQALFESIGNVSALPVSHAIYTDLGQSPDPAPMEMLEALIERDAPAILVVDNCPPDTHQALARRLAERSGPVRLITVEYDVRTDRAQETDVIRVEAEGPDIVEALLRRRFPDLASGDARRLAELALGNARLGFALAQAAPEADSLAAFEDSVLFDRLFWQRGERNEELARAAEVLSLVYSFEVEGEEEPDELAFLGSLAEISRTAMHRHATSLLDRGLAQARGRWRAVLPHALANRLARQALRSIPLRSIADGFASKRRLRRSLARRLSYLHDSDEARRVVARWIEAKGPLHGPTPDLEVLEAVCHLVPNEALQIIDAVRAVPGAFHHLDGLTRMISRIAHSEAMFRRACESLVAVAIAPEERRASNAEDALGSLFGLYLSGTRAQTATRIQVARECLLANDPGRNACGVIMLSSALRTGQWSSSFLSYDDARPDAFGWEPRGQEVTDWFARWLDLVAAAALNGPPAIRERVRKALAEEIDGIWRCMPSLRPRIDELARQLHAAAPWLEGRHSLRQMLFYIRRRGEEFPRADVDDVLRLIDHMAPRDLEALVRAEMVTGWDYDLENEDEDATSVMARRAQRLELLGRELAANRDTLRAVGRDLLEAEGGSFYSLGTGLAQGADGAAEVWADLRDLYLIGPSGVRQSIILSGFIQQLDISDRGLADKIRAECRATPALRREYGMFLARGVLPAEELEHVIEIVSDPETSVWQLGDVSWQEERELHDGDRVRLLRAILARSDGPERVVEALNMLRHVEGNARDHWPEDLREVGLEAVEGVVGAEHFNLAMSARAANVLSACLRGGDGAGARRAMAAMVDRAVRRYGSTHDIEGGLATLAEQAPEVFLDGVFPADAAEPTLRFRDGRRSGPLMRVPPEALIGWCGQDASRWRRVAQQISPFSSGIDDDGETGTISPLALAFLEAAPRPEEVVETYLGHLEPMSWSGSRADIMERRLAILEALPDHLSEEVRHTVARLAPDIRARLHRLRQVEQEGDRERDLRFE